jgi:hypothetical protein
LENIKKIYSCNVYNARNLFLFCFAAFILILGIFAIIGLLAKIIFILPLGFVILSVTIFSYQKKIKNLFTKRAFLEFTNESFTVTLRNLKNERGIVKSVFFWEEIKSYKFYFTPSKLTYLDIYPKKGGFREFGFIDDKTEDQSIEEDSVFSIFRSYVKKYNSDKDEILKIVFVPGFLATKTGGVLLIFLGFAFLVIAISYMIFNARFNPVFLIGLFAFLPLIAKRKNDKNFYTRMKDQT